MFDLEQFNCLRWLQSWDRGLACSFTHLSKQHWERKWAISFYDSWWNHFMQCLFSLQCFDLILVELCCKFQRFGVWTQKTIDFKRRGALPFADKVIKPNSSLKLCHSKSSKLSDSVFSIGQIVWAKWRAYVWPHAIWGLREKETKGKKEGKKEGKNKGTMKSIINEITVNSAEWEWDHVKKPLAWSQICLPEETCRWFDENLWAVRPRFCLTCFSMLQPTQLANTSKLPEAPTPTDNQSKA